MTYVSAVVALVFLFFAAIGFASFFEEEVPREFGSKAKFIRNIAFIIGLGFLWRALSMYDILMRDHEQMEHQRMQEEDDEKKED